MYSIVVTFGYKSIDLLQVTRVLLASKTIKFLTKIRGYKQFGYFCCMRRIVYFFKFYIKSSIHAALAVTSLSLVTLLQFDQWIGLSVLFFIFSATLITYNFIKYAVVAKYDVLVKNTEIQKIQSFSFLVGLLAIVAFVNLSRQTQIVAFFFGLMTLLYALPFPFQKQNFRNQWGIKIFIVAFCWSGVSVLLPLADFQWWETSSFWMVWLQRYLLIIVWMFPFEIRDMKIDPPTLKTIPQRIGIQKTVTLGIVLLLFCLLLSLAFSKVLLADIGMMALTAFMLYKSRKDQSTYFSSFWVESLPIFWLGLYAMKLFL